MAAILGEEIPVTNEEKASMLLKHRIALWDSAASCDIVGSSDADMKNIIPNDIRPIIDASKIHTVFCNGKQSAAIYRKGIYPVIGKPAVTLPSTSPANAAYSLERLISEWSLVTHALKNGGLE